MRDKQIILEYLCEKKLYVSGCELVIDNLLAAQEMLDLCLKSIKKIGYQYKTKYGHKTNPAITLYKNLLHEHRQHLSVLGLSPKDFAKIKGGIQEENPEELSDAT